MAADPLGTVSDVFDFLGMDLLLDDEEGQKKQVRFVCQSATNLNHLCSQKKKNRIEQYIYIHTAVACFFF